MSIFKKKIPASILFELLDLVCESEKKHYIINKITFKHMTNHLTLFLDKCCEYYSNVGKKYLNVATYKSFLTVVRQICKSNNISFHYKIKYIHSTYEIEYYIQKGEGLKVPNPEGTFQNEIQSGDSREVNKIIF